MISLKTDPTPYTSHSVPTSTGSLIAGAVNPSLFQGLGRVGYQFRNNGFIAATAMQALAGESAPKGFAIMAELRIILDSRNRLSPSDEAGLPLPPENYHRANRGFVNYSLDAKVTGSNDRMSLVKIDKGSQDEIKVGQTFDFFTFGNRGSLGDAVARGLSLVSS